MKENKAFKDFRKALNESEYSEVLTGYGNRSAHKDDAGLHHLQSAGALAGINAMLATIGKGTYLDPNEAFLKMKVRLNVVQLDFAWKPGSWDGGVGSFDIPVVQFGRVDGYDAQTGQIRFDGKANPTGGYTELNLHVDVELTPESLYVVSAKLSPSVPVAEETEVTEDYQTPAREQEMKRKIAKYDERADRAYTTKMTSPSYKKAKAAEKRLDKLEGKVGRLIDRDNKEWHSSRTYGRGGKIVKRGSRAEVKEEIEQIDEAGQAKLERLGKAYDKARLGSRGVLNPENKKRLGDAYFSMRDKVLDKRKKRIEKGTFDKEKEVQARVAHNKKNYSKGVFGNVFGKKTVKEELVGGQKKLDLNKNKRLDAHDFAMLRAKKKKPMAEAKMKQWTPRLDKLVDNRDAVRSKPKKTILTQKVQDGKKVGSARPIRKHEG